MPSPVTATLRFISTESPHSQCAHVHSYHWTPLSFVRDEPIHGIYDLLYGSYPEFLVRNSNLKFIFDIKQKIHHIERIET